MFSVLVLPPATIIKCHQHDINWDFGVDGCVVGPPAESGESVPLDLKLALKTVAFSEAGS